MREGGERPAGCCRVTCKLSHIVNCWTCFFFLPCASPFAEGLGAGFGAGFGTALCEGMEASSTKSLVKYNFPLKTRPKPQTPRV